MALLILATSTNVWAVMALVAAQGSAFAFALTIRQAYTVDIVGSRQALSGLALTSIAMQAGGIAGSLASGVLIQELGAGWQYVAVAACYLASGLTLFVVRTSQPGYTGNATVGVQEPGRLHSIVAAEPQPSDPDGSRIDHGGIWIYPHGPAADLREGRSRRRGRQDWES